jgi:nucleolar protein 4
MAPATKKQRLSSGHAVEIAENVADNATPATTEKKESKDAEHKRSLFVRSLPPTATSESLTALFSDSYPVKHAVAINARRPSNVAATASSPSPTLKTPSAQKQSSTAT